MSLLNNEEYVQGLKLLNKEFLSWINIYERLIEKVYEEGETYTGEINKLLSELDLKRGQSGFAEMAVSFIETGKAPKPKPKSKPRPKSVAQDISDLMIERAREYPVKNLIEIKPNKHARCINPEHDDKNPSMAVYDDHVYCFSCGYHADAIEIYRTTEGVSFREAVKSLST